MLNLVFILFFKILYEKKIRTLAVNLELTIVTPL